jgi:hypothetical protein
MINLARDKAEVDSARVKIAEMNDFELMRCARTSAILNAVLPNDSSNCQLEEARREWRRRHCIYEESPSNRR